MREPLVIDTVMHGVTGITAAFVLRGEKTALVETGPKSSVDHVLTGLEEAGVDALDWIVVTHIHLDHAGAAGTIAARFPEATVAVHGLGAPHLVDPSKLWSSASRIYGDQMDRLWGGIDPLPAERIRIVEDGDKIDLGGRSLQAVETPGHAGHHHAFVDDETGIVFAGDAIGVRLPDVGIVRPATPPPEFGLELAIASIERIRGLGAKELWPTHFGGTSRGFNGLDVDGACDAGIESLRQWAGWVRGGRERSRDLDDVSRYVEDRARTAMEAALDPAGIARLEQTTSYRMNTMGYMRYFDKLEQTTS
ncbi:MAG: MBL fold metallo-hydrolase [Actinobacteria bacterium]|nr:MBL fold metallo-hydrolase [Actinomycetota bacterium]